MFFLTIYTLILLFFIISDLLKFLLREKIKLRCIPLIILLYLLQIIISLFITKYISITVFFINLLTFIICLYTSLKVFILFRSNEIDTLLVYKMIMIQGGINTITFILTIINVMCSK